MKEENSRRQKRSEKVGQLKGIGTALETRQYHTIEYGVTKIDPQRHWKVNKSPAVLRGSAARRSVGEPMCDHSTECKTHRGQYGSGRAP